LRKEGVGLLDVGHSQLIMEKKNHINELSQDFEQFDDLIHENQIEDKFECEDWDLSENEYHKLITSNDEKPDGSETILQGEVIESQKLGNDKTGTIADFSSRKYSNRIR
jgi:hypothetical protein